MATKKMLQTNLPTQQQTEKFDLLLPLLNSLLAEMREFAKKKQDGVLNPMKVKLINRLLGDIKETLGSDGSIEYLDLLDEDSLPQNSDAVLILGQFQAAMNIFKSTYYGYDSSRGEYKWHTRTN